MKLRQKKHRKLRWHTSIR